MRANFPETTAYLKAKRARHPRDDAIEDYTQWTLLGEPVAPQQHIPKPGQEAALVGKAAAPKKEESEEESEEVEIHHASHHAKRVPCHHANPATTRTMPPSEPCHHAHTHTHTQHHEPCTHLPIGPRMG